MFQYSALVSERYFESDSDKGLNGFYGVPPEHTHKLTSITMVVVEDFYPSVLAIKSFPCFSSQFCLQIHMLIAVVTSC